MIRSIRHFLLISLLISITIASSITAIGNYVLDRQVVQPYLDEQLIKLITFLEILSSSSNVATTEKRLMGEFNLSSKAKMGDLLYQVWDAQQKIILYSPNSTTLSLFTMPLGFSDKSINGNQWRAYAKMDRLGNKIIVAEPLEIRNKLADDIAHNNGYILLISYPIFGILIWIIVGLALQSITRVTNEISNRASTYLEPVKTDNLPIEIKPLVIELNQLFIHLKLAFERNKRFASDAAHELRTPLAALKTQAQVALKSNNKVEQYDALKKVVQGVDRSSHVVAQLLTLSRLSQEEQLNDINPIDIHKLAAEMIAYLVPTALEKNIEVELAPPPPKTIVLGNDVALGILIRNVVDNAMRYTPPHGEVKILILNKNKHVIFRVADTGPGIPPELRERVFERFYRIPGTATQGSGLGLAIVHQITELHHATIELSTPENGEGLQFDVIFPAVCNPS